MLVVTFSLALFFSPFFPSVEAGGSEDTVVGQETSIETGSTTIDNNSTAKELVPLLPPPKRPSEKADSKQPSSVKQVERDSADVSSEARTGSYRDLRSSPTLRQAMSYLVPNPATTSSLNRRLKAGPSVSSSQVMALPGSGGTHRRQASWGVWYGSGASPRSIEHRRHNSYR